MPIWFMDIQKRFLDIWEPFILKTVVNLRVFGGKENLSCFSELDVQDCVRQEVSFPCFPLLDIAM